MSSNKMTKEDLESLFNESYTTIFCSHNDDGTIHAAPIWYNYRDNIFYFVSIKKSKRVENIRRNTNVSLSFLMQGSEAGEGDIPSKCALVYGVAELGFKPEEGYDEYVRWVWGKYHHEPSYNPKFDPETQVTIRVIPKKVVHFYPNRGHNCSQYMHSYWYMFTGISKAMIPKGMTCFGAPCFFARPI